MRSALFHWRLRWVRWICTIHWQWLFQLHYYCHCREGTLKVGDRVLAANGVSLMQRTLSQALNFLRDVPDDEVAFLVEYDVSVLGQYTMGQKTDHFFLKRVCNSCIWWHRNAFSYEIFGFVSGVRLVLRVDLFKYYICFFVSTDVWLLDFAC